MPGRKLIQVDGWTPKDDRELEREAERRGMLLCRFRAQLLREGLKAIRTEQNAE